MQIRRAVIFLVLVAGCSRQAQPPAQDAAKGAGKGSTVFVKDQKGITRLPIENDGADPLTVNLSSGPVTDATTGAEISGAAVSFRTEAGGQAIANASAQPATTATQPASGAAAQTTPKPAQSLTVPAHASMNVLVNVSGLTGTTWAKMEVYNQGAEMGTMDLVVLDDPVNVSVDGLGATAATPLSTDYGSTLTFTLKNNSAEFLALDCSLELRDSSSHCGKIVLPPNTSKSVPVDLDGGAYSWTDWVQPTVQTGELKLTTQVPPGTAAQVVPVKVLPLNLTMQGPGPLGLAILSLIYVGVFLFIGGYLSVLASTVLPNMVKKAEMRKQVDELANRTSSVSTRVDSYLRVLLRLERKKIQVALEFLKGTSPSAAEQFTDISTQIAGLLKRLTVAERLDKLRRAFEDKSATAPPSISDGIDKNLDTAAVQLHSFVLNDTDVAASNAYLDKAEALLKLLDDKDAQARLIAQNYVQLRNRLQAFPRGYYTDLQKALSGIFDSLNFGKKPGDAGTSPANPGNGSNSGNSGNPANTNTAGNPAGAGNTGTPGDQSNPADSGSAGQSGQGATPVPDGSPDQTAASNPAGSAANAGGQTGTVDSGTPNPPDQSADSVPAAPESQPPAGDPDANADASVKTTPQVPLNQPASPDKGTDAVPVPAASAPAATASAAAPAASSGAAATGNPPAPPPVEPKPSGGSPSDFSDPKNIISPMFFAIDHGIAAIQTVLDYAIVRASVATGTSKNCTDPGQDAMKRLKQHECQLLNLLGTMSWKSLRGAITLVQQMREDVYESDVYEHIKSNRAKITFDTQRARPFLPVFFSIGFDDPRLSGAAALDWVGLDWDFPSDLHEVGWKVCHYFDGKEKIEPRGSDALIDPEAAKNKVSIKVVAKSPRWPDSQTLVTRIEVQPDTPQAEKAGVFADRLRFAIAFGVALAGLKSGALDQLAKLGFVQATVAIIALGFGADTVKNVLTQSSKPQTTTAPPPPPAPPKTGP